MTQENQEQGISPVLLNFDKDDYHKADLFFGQRLGIMDTIHKHYPVLERLYKKLKALDWDEAEFPYGECNLEFKRMREKDKQPMINQLGWQWETDSVAARMVGPIMSGFLTDQTAVDLYSVITTNEIVHGRTYSEIIKYSFDDPEKMMADILGVKEHRQRLSIVAEVFEKAFFTSHDLATGKIKRDQKSFEIFFLFVVALFLMERGQFMVSFPITFTYGHHSHFMPICKAVQKICQDEYEIHAMAGAEMIDILLSTGPGITANYNNRHVVEKMVREVWSIERNNIDFLLCGQKSLFGVTQEDYRRQVDWFFSDIAKFLNVDLGIQTTKTPPLSFLKDWFNINSIQAALQEEKNGAYLLGMVVRDDMGRMFDVPGL